MNAFRGSLNAVLCISDMTVLSEQILDIKPSGLEVF